MYTYVFKLEKSKLNEWKYRIGYNSIAKWFSVRSNTKYTFDKQCYAKIYFSKYLTVTCLLTDMNKYM